MDLTLTSQTSSSCGSLGKVTYSGANPADSTPGLLKTHVCTAARMTALWCSFQNKPQTKFLHSSELTQHKTALTRTHKTQPAFNPIYCKSNAPVTGYQHLNMCLHNTQGQNCFYVFYFYNSNQQNTQLSRDSLQYV